jgi:flagellin-like hook-associated protein FlgL
MIQTAEGALGETHSILQRMRELSVQAANDTLTQQDRAYIQLEIDQLKEEIDRIADTTQFNKKKLLDGSADAVWSSSLLGVRVTVNGAVRGRDDFGQTGAFEGNYTVTADVLREGRNQVLKSNILTVATGNGIAAANVGSRLSTLTNFIDANGVNLLSDPQTLTISLEGGGSASVTVYADDTIGSLGTKLAAALAEASEAAVPPAGAQYVSDGGALGGIDADDALLRGMATNWLWGAMNRVVDAYGFEVPASGKTLEIRIVDDLGAAAAMGGGTSSGDGFITISRNALLNAAGSPTDTEMFERVLAHEMVHVLSFTYADSSLAAEQNTYQWLAEGLAEYAHGANDRIDASNMASVIAAAKTLIASPSTIPISLGSDGYAAAYLIVRYIDEVSRANGGNGIGKVTDPPGGADRSLLGVLGYAPAMYLDAALAAAGNGFFGTGTPDEVDVLKGIILQDTVSYNSAETFAAFVARVEAEDSTIDTGAIGGYYATLQTPPTQPALTPQSVVAGNNTFNIQPLAEFGWTVRWPTEVSAGGASTTLAVSATREDTLQAVDGTLLLHSGVAGLAGRISISGDERFLNALGFTEIQEAEETLYSVTVTDAHSGNLVANAVKVSGNTLRGILHENIDIRLADNFALEIDAENLRYGGYGSYVFDPARAGQNSFIVHIAAQNVVLQIGANEGEDMTVGFGDTSSAALGVDRVNVRERALAARALTLIDAAIDRVSTKRARLGAYQNRLEHSIASLTVAGENLTASESRIRDTDMAKEMMNFTKLQIILQAGTGMLAQANIQPQNVLTLLR